MESSYQISYADEKEEIQQLNISLGEHIANYRYFGTDREELASQRLLEVNKKIEILVKQKSEQAYSRHQYEELQQKYVAATQTIRSLNEKVIRFETEQECSKVYTAELELKLEQMEKKLKAETYAYMKVEQHLKIKEELSADLFAAWKDELSAAIVDIREQYQKRENRIQKEYETTLKSRIEIAREEENTILTKKFQRLETQLVDAKSRYELMEKQYEALLISYDEKTEREERQSQRSSLIIEIEQMKSERVSIKEEIEEYRKLLLAAERRFNLVVEKLGGKLLTLEVDNSEEVHVVASFTSTNELEGGVKFQEGGEEQNPTIED